MSILENFLPAYLEEVVGDRFGRSDLLPEIDHRFLHPFQVHAVVDMTHMVDVLGQNADRVMIGLAHHGRRMGVADIGVNIVTGAVLQFAAGRSGQSLGGRWRSGEGRQLLIEGPFEGGPCFAAGDIGLEVCKFRKQGPCGRAA